MQVVKVVDLNLRKGRGRTATPETLKLRDDVKSLKKGDALLIPVAVGETSYNVMSRTRNTIDGEVSLKSKYSIMRTAEGEIAVFHRTKK